MKHQNPFVPAKRSLIQNMMARWVNSTRWLDMRYKILSKLPYVQMKSDAENIVYMNWLVPIELVKHHIGYLIPNGAKLLEQNGMTILTILTYQHKHFGPKFIGPLRKIFPSPQQSNWRFYLDYVDPTNDKRTVVFIKNMMDSALYSYVTRLFTDVLPTHFPLSFIHSVTDSYISTEIKAGASQSGEMSFLGINRGDKVLPEGYESFFSSWDEAMAYLCLQNSAISIGHCDNFIAKADISLPININDIQPVDTIDFIPGEMLCKLEANTKPFCFLVKNVIFEVLSETRINAKQPP